MNGAARLIICQFWLARKKKGESLDDSKEKEEEREAGKKDEERKNE